MTKIKCNDDIVFLHITSSTFSVRINTDPYSRPIGKTKVTTKKEFYGQLTYDGDLREHVSKVLTKSEAETINIINASMSDVPNIPFAEGEESLRMDDRSKVIEAAVAMLPDHVTILTSGVACAATDFLYPHEIYWAKNKDEYNELTPLYEGWISAVMDHDNPNGVANAQKFSQPWFRAVCNYHPYLIPKEKE